MRLFFALLFLTFASLASWDYFIQHHKETESLLHEDRDADARYLAGFQTYKAHCQNCHGKRVDGKGTFTGLNEIKTPADFTSKAFSKSKKEIKKIIRNGGAAAGLSPMMPKWKTILSDEEITQVVYFLQAVNEEGGIRQRNQMH